MTGPENSRHPLNQSDATDHDLVARVFPRFGQFGHFLDQSDAKLIITNRASNFLLVFSLRPHLLCDYLVFFLLASVIILVLVLRQLIKTCSNSQSEQLLVM